MVSEDQILLFGTTDAGAADRFNGIYYLLGLDGTLQSSHRLNTPTRSWIFDASANPEGFFITGWVNNRRTADDVMFLQIDRKGRQQFGRRYGREAADEQIRTQVPLPDGSYLCVGNLGTGTEATVTVVDKNGDVAWRRSLSYPATNYNLFTDATLGLNGAYYLAGVSLIGDGATASFLAKVSPVGELLWQRRYQTASGRDGGATRTLARLPDGDLVMSTSVADTLGGPDRTLLLKIGPAGEAKSATSLVAPWPITFRDCLVTEDGTLLLVGSALREERAYGLVLEMDEGGNILNQQLVGHRGGTTLADIAPGPNGGYYVAGTTADCPSGQTAVRPSSDLLLAYLDENLSNDLVCSLPPATLTSRPAPFPTMIDSSYGVWVSRTEPESPAPVATPDVAEVEQYRCLNAASLPADHGTHCFGDSVDVDVTTPGGKAYRWPDGGAGPVRRLAAPADLSVEVTVGCASGPVPVVVAGEDCCRPYLPTAFSPNDDGVNDGFAPIFPGFGCEAITGYHLRIFDRWGSEVFGNEDPRVGWAGDVRGRPAPVGSYVYTVAYLSGPAPVFYSGQVTLVR